MSPQDPSFDRRALSAVCLASAGVGLALALLNSTGPIGGVAEVIRNAAGIPEDSPEGLGKFVSAANRLLTPATLAAAAVMPFGVIAGGLMMGFGRPKGVTLVAASLGALVLIASAKGLVL